MELIPRTKNVVDGNEDLLTLHNLKNFPVFMGCINHESDNDLRADMSWAISRNTGVIQLKSLIPLNILYQSEHDSGVIGNIWLQHHQEFATFIQKFRPESILEIGGAHGILSREYRKENYIDWSILEPNPSPAEGVDATFIKGFFDDKFTFDKNVDTIVHSHLFEHVYYPDKFINHISRFLSEGQNLIFSLPNMEEMLKRNYTNCLNFEHTVFITEPYIEFFLSKYGFRLIEKKYFKDDHSIFYAYVKDKKIKKTDLPKMLYEHNKKIFLDYIHYHQKLISDLNIKISNTKINQPIYLFGAHVFAQSLIQFGLNTSRIINLLDNDINKQDLRLYGTNLEVKSPNILAKIKNPIVIMKAGIYNNEIIEDILKNINSNTIFWD